MWTSLQPLLRQLADDESRFDGVTTLGVDEHVWHHVSTKPPEQGGRRPKELIQGSLGVATNVLSQRLATLTAEGILGRHPYSGHPDRFEYRLTEKGRDLIPVLWALLRWGDRWTADQAGPPLELVHADCGEAFHMVPTCSACGKELIPGRGHIHARRGPGA